MGLGRIVDRNTCGRVRVSVAVCGLMLPILFSSANMTGQAQQPRVRTDSRTITPNRTAPELYSDELPLKITLVNLPGAEEPGSYWQGEFKVYFVAEQDFEKIMKELQRDRRNRELKPEYFPDRILLAEGNFRKNKLRTLDERTFLRPGISFKRKIPAQQRTSFSSLLTFFSVKVHDAKLNRDVYESDVFISPPFDTDSGDRNTFSPRTGFYLSFYVDERGSLFWSGRKKAGESTKWNSN